ncbi:hypothetical protein CYMTET_7609, partial [Cymbomonas tetramitiformis]
MTKNEGVLVGNGAPKFLLSCDINLPVSVKVEKFSGALEVSKDAAQEDFASNLTHLALPSRSPQEFYTTIDIYSDGELIGAGTRTTLAEKPAESCHWTDWRTLCVKYRDLPVSAQLVLTVWRVSEVHAEEPVGGAVLRLFGKDKTLKTGKQKVRLTRGQAADSSDASTTPGKIPKAERGELDRITKVMKKYEAGYLPQVEWLDLLALKQIEKIKAEDEANMRSSGQLFLYLELPSFDHPAVFHEQQLVAAPAQAAVAGVGHGFQSDSLLWLVDSELAYENPALAKQHKLARGVTRGIIDSALKPDVKERREISRLLRLPPTRSLPADAKQLLWKFRFHLREEKEALTKFLQCVD